MITYKLENIHELRQKFDPKLVDRALGQALQVATTKLRTRVSREIRGTYKIKAGDVAKTVTIRRIEHHTRLMVFAGRMIGLDKFSSRPKKVTTARGRRVGATVMVRKDRGRKVVTGGFIAKGNLIFKREGTERLPIERLYGPSIAHMAGNKVVGELATAQVGEDAGTEFNRYLEYLMTQA